MKNASNQKNMLENTLSMTRSYLQSISHPEDDVVKSVILQKRKKRVKKEQQTKQVRESKSRWNIKRKKKKEQKERKKKKTKTKILLVQQRASLPSPPR